MNIKALLDLTAGHVAKLIKGARPFCYRFRCNRL
jgi:hypothetical protein